MASATVIPLLASLLVLQPWTATGDFLSPLLSPVLDDACKEVECGKGTCKASMNSTAFYECDCDPGWTQTRTVLDKKLKFLPCVMPNCSLDFSCAEAAPSAPDREIRANMSILDPCHWVHCGGGTCNKTSLFTYKCGCRDGYSNLLNITAFPCFKECAFGVDCSSLGITVANSSTPPTTGLADSGSNQGTSTSYSYLNWLGIVMVVSASILRK